MIINDLNLEELWKYFEEKTLHLIENKFRPSNEIILNDLELQDLLKISRRTSLEWRNKGFLRYHKIGDGKIYYFLNEIIEDIKKCTKESN